MDFHNDSGWEFSRIRNDHFFEEALQWPFSVAKPERCLLVIEECRTRAGSPIGSGLVSSWIRGPPWVGSSEAIVGRRRVGAGAARRWSTIRRSIWIPLHYAVVLHAHSINEAYGLMAGH